MRRGLNGLACVAYTAPLLGFLGTCFGILGSFKCCIFGGHSPYLGIAFRMSEALIPIGISLTVALPVFWIYRYLCGRVEAYEVEMKRTAEELVYCLERLGHD